jgi:hypothetical protein
MARAIVGTVMKLRWLVAVVFVVALAGGGTFALRSMADAGSALEPPSAVMHTENGAQVRGGTGTYCWRNGSTGVCADAVGLISNDQPIELGPRRWVLTGVRQYTAIVD